MIITISGMPGSGKSTVAGIIAKKLGIKHHSAGDFRRKKAAEKGMTIREYNRLGEKEASTDNEADEWQKKLSESKDSFVIDGRLSYHFIPKSKKIFLKTSAEEGAKRILKDTARKEQYKSIEEAKQKIGERIKSDTKRYRKYYGINPYNEENYDLVIDTTSITAPEAAREILDFLKKQKQF